MNHDKPDQQTSPPEITARPAESSAASTGPETSLPAEPPQTPPQDAAAGFELELIDALRQVVDPELMINIIDLGLVYEINREGKRVDVAMTLTSPACPAGPQIMQQSKMALERLEGVEEARIRLVMSPPWSPDRMTDEARDQLGIF